VRSIIHVDMDAFFASVEVLDQPELRGQAVIVGGLGPRGVVSAASYEARRFGVHSALPMARARRLCPHGVFLAPRLARYAEVSRAIFAVFENFTPLVEGLSLDEAFLDVSACRRLLGSIDAIGGRIKHDVLAATGLTCSVGMASNKFLAKLASDHAKPDGFVHVTDDAAQQFLDPLPVTRLWGIGRKAGDRLTRAGIGTIGDLRRAGDARLTSLLGRQAPHFRALACGIDDRPVVADGAHKSIGSEETFDRDLRDPAALHTRLLAHVDRTAARLRAAGLRARTVTLKIRTPDFATHTRQASFEPPSAHTRTLQGAAESLLADWLRAHPRGAVRLLGVTASGLDRGDQADLFATAAPLHGDRLDAVIDAVHQQFGDHALVRAGTLGRKPREH